MNHNHRDTNTEGSSKDDPYGSGPRAAKERDADAFALRVGKRLGIDTKGQMAFYNTALLTYDEWTSQHGVRGNHVLYAASATRKQARQMSGKAKRSFLKGLNLE